MGAELKILQVNTADDVGGAATVASSLHRGYLGRGISSWLAVGRKYGTLENVILIPNQEYLSRWTKFWRSISDGLKPWTGKGLGLGKLSRYCETVSNLERLVKDYRGFEDFDYPASRRLLELMPQEPDIVHLHNLHGGYFDLRFLPKLSAIKPTALTLHDAWLLAGHCAHSFDCDRWRRGCGNCPYLDISQPLRHDGSAHNLEVKKEIYKKSHLYIATPCHWLMDRVKNSVLADSIIESRIIPNGVNLNIFKPDDKVEARRKLGLPEDAFIVLISSQGLKSNMWKDYDLLKAVLRVVSIDRCKRLQYVFVGAEEPEYNLAPGRIKHIGYQKTRGGMATCYQAADIYLHPARADTFPNIVLESQACGTPVVATAVGGIPEQIVDGTTGYLVPAADHKLMASRVEELYADELLRERMGSAAALAMKIKFDINREIESYLNWYKEILHSKTSQS